MTLMDQDPYGSESFGGDEDEFAIIGGKLKADSELWDKVHKDHKGQPTAPDQDDADQEAPKAKRGAKAKADPKK